MLKSATSSATQAIPAPKLCRRRRNIMIFEVHRKRLCRLNSGGPIDLITAVSSKYYLSLAPTLNVMTHASSVGIYMMMNYQGNVSRTCGCGWRLYTDHISLAVVITVHNERREAMQKVKHKEESAGQCTRWERIRQHRQRTRIQKA